MILAMRALRHPQTGLAGVLAAVQPQLEAGLAAVYLAPPGPGPVELVAASGGRAADLGGPGQLEGAMCRAVRALVGRPAGWSPPSSIPLEPWTSFGSLGHIPTPLPSGGACLLLVGAGRQGGVEDLRRASAPAAVLAALLSSSREVENLRHELHEVRQSQSLLAAGIQHDLRTPLTSILGSARTLMTQGDLLAQGDRDELLQIVASQAERLTEMLAEALVPDTLGPDAPLRLAEWDMAEVATRASGAAKVGRGGQVVIDVAPATLVTDAGRVERALLNLLDNALKYAPEGAPAHLGGAPHDVGYRFTVADPGPGVSEAIVPTLFSAYATDPNRAGGIGLGLHSVATLAAELGGRIAYARHEGWTRFSLWLPDLRGQGAAPVPEVAEVGR